MSLLKANLPYNLAKFQGAKVRKNIKYLIYKFFLGNVFLAIFVISFYVASWHLTMLSGLDVIGFLKGYFLFPGDIRLPFTTAILELFAFYISSSLSDFYVKGIDRKLNFIFFIAFATIGIFIVNILSLFMIFGTIVWQKSNAAFSAMCLFLGIIWTAWLFKSSEYELGKFLQNCSSKRHYKIDKALLIVLLIIALLVIIPIIAKSF